ncbi:conserved hypothetical protein [Thermotomaculum hydrothermale]|uniref:GTP cyclohydrolase 1 type 2 homolog n=1 Tax=Thermotomaculum hydrothermale TaxID=981385 RepID=A0A7R6SYQ3_9BACT|nr:Nif3-like dinuclear metal center hexameric protein [Thermotomaculum hydrothermale]BBB31967.1 conserved hypothetical protein [Thermotomaculum hydrothermale]
MGVERDKVIDFLNSVFKVEEWKDSSMNGLQVEGADEVSGIALGVDACLELFEKAKKENMNFVVVHHGFFWGKVFPISSFWKERFKFLLENDMSLYACHLPMDANPTLGHNATIANRLNLLNISPFGEYHGDYIGFSGEFENELNIEEVKEKLSNLFDYGVRIFKFGKESIKRVGVVSGDAATEDILKECADKNIDLFITGETNHVAYHIIKELKLNVAFCGHYATERFSLFELEKILEEEFNLPVKFFEIPTGM